MNKRLLLDLEKMGIPLEEGNDQTTEDESDQLEVAKSELGVS